jgi:cell division protein FtsI (penicillin-binding protein 3)
MMESVTAPEGTAPGARVPGYRVAGKTGTSRKVGAGGYDDKRHVALFAGMAPATDPRFVMVVVINEPKGEQVGGGSVSGPVFGHVAARALRLLGVRPDADLTI